MVAPTGEACRDSRSVAAQQRGRRARERVEWGMTLAGGTAIHDRFLTGAALPMGRLDRAGGDTR